MKSLTPFWIVVALTLFIGRLLVVTEIDTSPTSLFKDYAHLMLGGMWCAAWRDGSWPLFTLFAVVTIFETVMALTT